MHRTTIQLSDFAWEALNEEAERQDVALEDLLAHAAMYYLADLDSGRMAARVFRDEHAPGVSGRTRRFKPPDSD